MLKFLTVVSIFCTIAACATDQPGEFIPYYQVETSKPYDDALSELKVAISDNNFRITSHSRVGKVIRERGSKDFPEFDTIQFCNLTHARTILLIAPEAIRHMPCNIVLYQSRGKTVVRTHLLPTDTDNGRLNRFSSQMNEVLKKIVDFAVEE